MEAYRAPDPETFRAALDKALAHAGPALIEVPLAIEPPWELLIARRTVARGGAGWTRAPAAVPDFTPL